MLKTNDSTTSYSFVLNNNVFLKLEVCSFAVTTSPMAGALLFCAVRSHNTQCVSSDWKEGKQETSCITYSILLNAHWTTYFVQDSRSMHGPE